METRELHNLGMRKKCTREAHGNRGLGTPTQSVETRELHRLLIPERKEKKKKENPSHTTSETKKKTLHTPPKKQKRKPFTHHLRNQKKKRSGVGQPRGKKRCALGRHISKQQKAGLGHPSPQRPHGDSGAPQPGDGGEKKPFTPPPSKPNTMVVVAGKKRCVHSGGT